ncbi:hypothetical protein Aru02nite_11240 [Actinocatenispora rupis]|uniref:Uncharacterized protein n=1 Tax=Actinocatenispora rupis TaxID=519421 RepID=A0A8J3NAZ5_9ACTN|nr:hypothetical protein Aru02nite_11240 [Actinocatenispora rupis]
MRGALQREAGPGERVECPLQPSHRRAELIADIPNATAHLPSGGCPIGPPVRYPVAFDLRGEAAGRQLRWCKSG